MNEAAPRPASVQRHFGMDWLRIGAFLLLILYHVGLAFGPWPFELKAAQPRDWVAIPLLGTNAWRLPLLFLVSGFASAALLRRQPSPGAFTRSRLARLGLPILFAMLVLNTPQPWVALVTQHDYLNSFPEFLVRDYYRPQDIDGVKVPTWMHLWFVVYLLVYTLLLGLALALFRPALGPVKQVVERVLGGALLLPLPVLAIFAARALLPPGWTDTNGLFDDWSAHAVYLPVFAFGLMLQRSQVLRSAIDRQWKIGVVISLCAYAIIVAVELRWPGNTPLPEALKLPYQLVRSVQLWGTMIGLVGIANRFLDRDHRWRPILAEAVFPLYIIHQTIILVVGYWLLGTPTGALSRFLILVVATLGGSWLFYLGGRRISWLRPLIGLRRKVPS